METQDKLDKGIGTKETIALKPANVKIVDVKVEMQKNKEGKDVGEKVICTVKHPDKEETIEISSVKYENKSSKLVVTGIWYKEDEDKLLQKGSALSTLLNFLAAKTLRELIGKEVATVLDEKGYLCFKAY